MKIMDTLWAFSFTALVVLIAVVLLLCGVLVNLTSAIRTLIQALREDK